MIKNILAMNKSILWFLAAVIVFARCSAESIPATSETSGFAVPYSTQAHEHDMHTIRGNVEALHEEREIFPIESFISSVKAADESRPGTIDAVNMVDEPQLTESNKALTVHKANMMDVSEIKELNEVLATRMETLGIDIGGVVLVAKALKSAFPCFSVNNIEWMILGKVYFQRDGSSTGYRVLPSKELFKELNMKITNYEEIKKWTARFKNLQVEARMVFGKMLWLIQNRNELNLHLADVAKMAFGSEYLKKRKLPTAKEILQAVGEQNVNSALVESIVRQDKDSRKRKMRTDRGPFAIESFTSSVKAADESLPRTKPAANMMDVSEIKERNEVLATRMEALGIDIDAIVSVTELLKPFFKDFSLNNLEWMILGKLYFEKEESSSGHIALRSQTAFKELNMEIIDKKGIKTWITRLNSFQVQTQKVFWKMLCLIQNHNELNLHLADVAKMAFGSEYLEKRKLPTANEILQAAGDQNVNKDLVESVLGQVKDSRKRKMPSHRGPFAIESFTLSVKAADESLPRTKHADSMMDVSEIKERNEVLATQMEKLGIDIGGVVFITGALASELKRSFSRNNLGWMVLGKIYFEKIHFPSSGYRILSSKELFEELNMEIIDNVEFTKWRGRVNGYRVKVKKVFGKMFWLMNKLKLDLADAAKMAFGSELFFQRELPFSDELLQTVMERNVDKDVTESLIRQDKDSIMTDLAGDKQKATRKSVGEGSHEQSNKYRKLA